MNFDLYELISYLANQNEPGVYDLEDEGSLIEFLWEYYNINIEDFEFLINDLLPLCTIGRSPLTDKLYTGFGINDTWLIKKEVQ